MARRARPDGSAAAARVAALMPPQAGGWVPPEEVGSGWTPEVVPSAAAPDGPTDDLAEEHVAAAAEPPTRAVPWRQLPAPVEEPADEQSWGARRPGAHVATDGRFRIDPGRRGAVALVLATALAAVVAGGFAVHRRPQEVPVPVLEAAGAPLPGTSTPAVPTGELVVAVAGKVRKPGLLRLPAGSRVDDAVRAAGGPQPGVDLGVLNLARRLVDGEQVLVGLAPPPAAAGAGGASSGGLLDLNAASPSDLDALPGIGPVLAQRIVDWRTENGRFASVDQLREVTGIGEAKYEDLRAKVTV